MGKDAQIKVLAECGIAPVKCSTILYKISYNDLYDIAVTNGWVTKDAKDAVIDSLNTRLKALETTITAMNTSITAMESTIQGYENTIKLYEEAETESDYSDESDESDDSEECDVCEGKTQADIPFVPLERVYHQMTHRDENGCYYDEYEYYGAEYYEYMDELQREYEFQEAGPDPTPEYYIEDEDDDEDDYQDSTPDYYEYDSSNDDDDDSEVAEEGKTILELLKQKA